VLGRIVMRQARRDLPPCFSAARPGGDEAIVDGDAATR